MRNPPHRAYSYKVTVDPTGPAVSLDTVKLHLGIPITNTFFDALLTIYVDAATSYAEGITRRSFITRTFQTYRDYFPDIYYGAEGYYYDQGIELRRSPLQAIIDIQYFSGGVLTTVDPTIYYGTVEDDYSEVLVVDGQQWPSDLDRRMQCIEINFLAGLGDTDSDMPGWVTAGILNHVSMMFNNRGDCGACGDTTGNLIPTNTKSMYLSERIENL